MSVESVESVSAPQYAIYFNEGPGYLLVDHLSSHGNYSVTMLVQSLQDHKIYVRKLHSVQTFKDKLEIQCDDERQVVSESHVPTLKSATYYHREITETRLNETHTHRYVTPVTTWEFCNGGELNSLFVEWEQGDTMKVPEALIWNFFSSLLQTMININEKGLNHGDLHTSNLFLHWPDNAILPEVYVADFGFAQNYPSARNTPFAIPWTGSFDSRGKPVSNSLTPNEKYAIQKWYAQALQDMRNILFTLQTLVVTACFTDFVEDEFSDMEICASELFIDAARRCAGINGYSPELIKMMAALSLISTKLWNNPTKYMANLKQLRIEVSLQGKRVIEDFNRNPDNRVHTDYFRPLFPHRTKVLTWDSPSEIINPDTVSQNLPLTNTLDEMEARAQDTDFNVFRVYETGSWKAEHPLYSISHRKLSKNIDLQADEFQIVELYRDPITGELDLGHLSFVTPQSIPPPSPATSTSTSTFRIEQRTLPNRPINPPTPVTHAQHRPNFIQNWVNARLSPD